MKPKFTPTLYKEPNLNSPLRKLYKDFYKQEDKIEWLKKNKDKIEKEYEINVITLINSYLNDNWPQRKERNIAN